MGRIADDKFFKSVDFSPRFAKRGRGGGEKERERERERDCFHTVSSLYVLTDGFRLIFYLVLQKIKLKLDDMLPLQFTRGKKNKKLFKGSPYGREEWSKILSGFTQKAKYSKTI